MPVPGRVTMTILQGKELVKHDRATGAVKGTKIDPYLKVQLGVGKTAPKKKSQPIKNTNKNPDFGGQELTFDIVNPAALIHDGSISFHVGVWDDNTFSDDLLGEVTFSIMDLFEDKEAQAWCVLLRSVCCVPWRCVTGPWWWWWWSLLRGLAAGGHARLTRAV